MLNAERVFLKAAEKAENVYEQNYSSGDKFKQLSFADGRKTKVDSSIKELK